MLNNKKQKNIPKGWQEKRLGDICIFKKGKGLPKSEIKNNAKNKCIHYGELFIKYNEKIDQIISFTNLNKDKMFLSKINDILMPTSDVTPRGLSTASCIMKKDVILGGDVLIIRCKNNDLNGLFFSYYVNARKREIIRLVSGTTVFHLYGSDMAKLKLFLPPLPEQKQIVKILETWDKYLEKLSRKIEIKKNIKKGIASQIMNCELLIVNGKKVYAPKVRLSGFSGEWESVKLGDICQRIRTGKLDANAMVENGKYRFYTCAKDFYKIDDYAFDTEALLISGNGANVGYIHYYKGRFNAYQRIYILDRFKNNIFFIKYILDKFLKQRIFAEKCDGNTPYIKMDTLTDMKIKIPKSQEEQTAIAKILTTADKEIEVLEKKKKIIEDQKKYLLNNLVTGNIIVNC